jgi:hypothetical protein
MNEKLKDELIYQFESKFTVTQYHLHKNWVLNHIYRLAEEFGHLEIGKPFKFTIGDITRVAILKGFVIGSNFIGVDTGFGNVWYYQTSKPTKAELKKFDGHCLIVE